MKKDYLKPELDVVEISIDTIMQSTSDQIPIIPGESDGREAGRNRGEWGNVWGK